MTGASAKLEWETRTIAALGLRFDFLAGAAVTGGVFEGVTYLVQAADPLLLGVWYGDGQDLATFRSGFGPHQPVTFDAEERLRICGQRARRQVARVAGAVPSVGLVRGPDGLLGHLWSESEAITQVAVALRRGDQDVLIRWQVTTPERTRYRLAEAHFFASIVCVAS